MGVKPSRSVSIGPVSNDLGVNEPVPSPLGGQSPGFEKRMHSLMGEVPFEVRRGGVEQDKVAERAVVGQPAVGPVLDHLWHDNAAFRRRCREIEDWAHGWLADAAPFVTPVVGGKFVHPLNAEPFAPDAANDRDAA